MASDYTLMLEEAARDGNLELLANLVEENRSVLVDFKLASLKESLLHVATKSRQQYFARDLLRIDPGIARELNKDGFRPLDIAMIAGDFEMVEEILSFDRDLCRLKGKDRRTALHYAAIKGRVDAIDLLLLSSSPCAVLEDVTVHGETALHLAVKNYQVDVFFALLKWLEGPAKESVLDMGNRDGNTVLHVAVSTRQYDVSSSDAYVLTRTRSWSNSESAEWTWSMARLTVYREVGV